MKSKELFLVGLSAPMVQVGKDITWQDSLILENEVSVLNNVLYADLTGVFLVVDKKLFKVHFYYNQHGYHLYLQWTSMEPLYQS